MHDLQVEKLTREAFAPFGDVIETEGADHFEINNGTTIRFHDLAKVETLGENARTMISIFRGKAFHAPISVAMMERHPLGSQAFYPLQKRPFLVVVAPDENGEPGRPHVFLAARGQGVNYHVDTWHHPLISLEAESEFLVVDRGGDGNNLEEAFYKEPFTIHALAMLSGNAAGSAADNTD